MVTLSSMAAFFAQMLEENKFEIRSTKQYQNLKLECPKLFRTFVI